MVKTLGSLESEKLFLLTACMAAIAAVLVVAVWAPIQQRAFTRAVESDWARVSLVTTDGRTTNLAALNGQVRVVTLMYTHCPGICPLALTTLQQMDSRLTNAQKRRVSLVALSLDPERDSLERLRQFSRDRGLDSAHWIVGRPSVAGAQRLAAGMGVNYRMQADNTVDHESLFVLLGKSGRVLARTSTTRGLDPKFFGALQAAVNAN